VQGVHIVRKVCIDRGETTSGKLKRDSVEPSSAEVQGVHRRELSFEFGEKTESLRILENSARRALSWCKCAQKELFRVLRKEKCRREDTHRVVEYSVGSARCASSRRTPGGRKEFSFQENFSNLSYSRSSNARCAQE
jgi:hypothetical protein